LLIAIGGKYSSKNVSKQHRVLLSFYCFAAALEALCLIALFILTFLQGTYIQVSVPGLAIIIQYYLNYRQLKIWDDIDPDDPQYEDKMNIVEIARMNRCDLNFDTWSKENSNAAKWIRRAVKLLTHKFFMFPFTHFYGYLHTTLRTQDYKVIWQSGMNLRKVDITTPIGKAIMIPGVFAPKNKNKKVNMEELYEGGEVFEDKNQIYDYIQRPEDEPRRIADKIPDTRVKDGFKKQIKIDIGIMRPVLILGNMYFIMTDYLNRETTQLFITASEMVVFSLIMIILQVRIM
jgi:hypothetical protein